MGFSAGTANANNRFGTACTDTSCSITINSGLGGDQYYLRMMSIYKDVRVRIVARDSSNNALSLQGAQAVVDATGKAQDVLRRIQVRVPLTASSTNQVSDAAISSTDAICKRFISMDGHFQSYAASAVSGLTSITTPPNPFCQ